MRALIVAAAVAAPLAYSAQAHASPGVEGTRNLGMSGATRSSSFGTNAVIHNPSNMHFAQVFAIEPMYQLKVQNRTSGLGIIVMDSLNNSRISLGLGYLFLRGTPEVTFADENGEDRDFELTHFGHEVLGALSVAIVKQWLSVGVKPKYQFSSLRYRDDMGLARNANNKLNSFGLDAGVTLNLLNWASVSFVANNLVGAHRPAYHDRRQVSIEGVERGPGPVDPNTVNELADYPLSVEHGLAIFPLRRYNFSLNFDGTYDFTTYRFEKHTRLTYAGGAEYVVGPVPIRIGAMWDGRGKGDKDDRAFVSGGIGYVKPAKVGGVGVDIGFGFRQQVSGPQKETLIGFNIGLRIHPDL